MLFRLALGALAAVFVIAAPVTASAEWRRAESAGFIVYSNGRESDLRDYVQKLETFDRVLHHRLGLPRDEAPPRKLPIYLVEGPRGIAQVFTGISRGVVGVYSPTTEDIFAAATRSDDDVLLHEYTHHFMFQNSQVAYPGWLVEGFAEYLMTADIDDGEVLIGGFNANRASWLVNSSWIPLEELLSKRPLEVRRGQHQNTYYAVAWLLTHWFMSDAERRSQLETYVTAVGAGGDPVETIQQVTGLNLEELRRTLRTYMSQRLQGIRYTGDLPTAEITVTTLPRSADDLLLIGQRLKVGVPDDRERRRRPRCDAWPPATPTIPSPCCNWATRSCILAIRRPAKPSWVSCWSGSPTMSRRCN